MAIFVHNEPTCLPVIQENGLPEVFYSIIEKGLEPVIEVIQSVPNALGALCLNQAGQDQLTARPSTIPSLFSIFTSEEHQRVLQEKENAVLIGTAIEELIRHHPSLKDMVLAAIKTTMARIEELGNAFTVPKEIQHWYTLLPSPSAVTVSESTDTVVAMEVDQNVATEQTANDPSAPAGESTAPQRDDFFGRSHDNVVISYIDVLGKVRMDVLVHGLMLTVSNIVPRGFLPAHAPLPRFCRRRRCDGSSCEVDLLAQSSFRLREQRHVGFARPSPPHDGGGCT